MFKDSFCSSPWFHIRILPNGNYNLCRNLNSKVITKNIKDVSIMDFYNGPEMSQFRLDFLNGIKQKLCSRCYYQDTFDMLSARKRQLLKSGITEENFEVKTRCSPHYEHFLHSFHNEGSSSYHPTDLQIDLGNTCNSSCIMCNPTYSSRLEKEYKILHTQNNQIFSNYQPVKNWTNDKNLVNKFISELVNLPSIKYIHFIGGETLFMKSFYDICDKLIENNLSKNLIIGTTSNGTIYNDKLEYYASKFKQFHLAVSIETLSPLNDYIRFGSKIDSVIDVIKKFKKLEENYPVFFNLQITPNIFTVYELDILFDFLIKNEITIETSDILKDPSFLRMELMPFDIRDEIIIKLENFIKKNNLKKFQIANTRDSNVRKQIIANNIIGYYDFIKNYKTPDNLEEERFRLVKFLKSFEILHKNKITDYAPRYTKFLSDYGY